MNYSDVTRLLGPPIEQSQGVTAAVWFYCDTGSYEDEAAAIFFQAKYEAAESLRSQSPDSFIVVEVQGYKVALDDVGETGDCKNFVRKGGYKPPAWLPQDLRK